MKGKLLLGITALGLLGGVSAGIGLKANETMLETKADSHVRSIYIDATAITGDYDFWVHAFTNGEGGGSQTVKAVPVEIEGRSNIFSASWDTDYKQLTVVEFNSGASFNWDTKIAQTKDLDIPGSGENVVVLNSGDFYNNSSIGSFYSDLQDGYYFCGTPNSWVPSSTYKITEDGAPIVVECDATNEFKVAHFLNGHWADDITTGSGDAASNNDINFSSGYNTYVNAAGKYAFSLYNGALYADYGEYRYAGTDGDSWNVLVEDADHPVVPLNGGAVTFNLTKDEKFKLLGKAAAWTYGTFKYSSLKDGDFYNSFYTDNNDNICCNIAGSYSVSITMNSHHNGEGMWTVQVISVGANPSDTNVVYVLDKYGNLLNSNHYAGLYDDDYGRGTGEVPATMQRYEGTTHMYQQVFWVEMDKVHFTDGTTYSWDYNISGTYSKAGKCLILDGTTDQYGKWSSNTWVWPQTAKFIENFMHFQNFDEDQLHWDGGTCTGATGYYELARGAYEALDPTYQAELSTLDYVVARLNAWAVANSSSFVVTNGVGSFSPSHSILGIQSGNNSNMSIAIILSITATMAAAVVGYGIYRKKHQAE